MVTTSIRNGLFISPTATVKNRVTAAEVKYIEKWKHSVAILLHDNP